MISGTKPAIGSSPLEVSRPTRPSPQPHWKQAVTTPKAAITVATLASAACAGITTERKAVIRTMKPSRMTIAITSPSRSEIPAARST